MKINNLDISILSYIGRLGPGVLTDLSIIYEDNKYQGMVFYTDKDLVLEIQEELRVKMGNIEDFSGYHEIIKYLNDSLIKYEDIATTLEEIK